jgi:hypothetical protein
MDGLLFPAPASANIARFTGHCGAPADADADDAFVAGGGSFAPGGQ